MRKVYLSLVIIALFVVGYESTSSTNVQSIGDVRSLSFPNLPIMHGNQPSRCEYSLPSNYSRDVPVPLFVWLSAGSGSHEIRHVPRIVDFDKYLVVALPYPEGQLPRVAIQNNSVDVFRSYHIAMLNKIRELVPNISNEMKVVGGFSSGSHLIGEWLDANWDGFSNYFNVFILHEGGLSRSMTFQGVRHDHRILVTYGDRSSQIRFQQTLIRQLNKTSGDVSVKVILGASHEFNEEVQKTIRSWVDSL